MRNALGTIYAGSALVFIISMLLAFFTNIHAFAVIFVASIVVGMISGVLLLLVDWFSGPSNDDTTEL